MSFYKIAVSVCVTPVAWRFILPFSPIAGNGNTRWSLAASIWNSPVSLRLNETRPALQARQMADLETGRNAGFSRGHQLFEDPTGFYRVFR
jgi:hypothetical protein